MSFDKQTDPDDEGQESLSESLGKVVPSPNGCRQSVLRSSSFLAPLLWGWIICQVFWSNCIPKLVQCMVCPLGKPMLFFLCLGICFFVAWPIGFYVLQYGPNEFTFLFALLAKPMNVILMRGKQGLFFLDISQPFIIFDGFLQMSSEKLIIDLMFHLTLV